MSEVTVQGERKLDICNEMEENYLGCSRKWQSRAQQMRQNVYMKREQKKNIHNV